MGITISSYQFQSVLGCLIYPLIILVLLSISVRIYSIFLVSEIELYVFIEIDISPFDRVGEYCPF